MKQKSVTVSTALVFPPTAANMDATVYLVQAHAYSTRLEAGRVVDAEIVEYYEVPTPPPSNPPDSGTLVPTGAGIKLLLPPGASAFPGAIGLAIAFAPPGYPGEFRPDAIAISGEFTGFFARITGSGDVNNKYDWEMDCEQAGSVKISSTVNRPQSYLPEVQYGTPLGKAQNVAAVTYHTAKITNRRTIPVGTSVWMRYSESAGCMVFDVFQDPNYAC